MRISLRYAVFSASLIVLTPAAASAQFMPGNDWMPRAGNVDYDMTLSQRWSPARIRMTGRIELRAGNMRQRHCMQWSYAPVMACQISVNGQPGPITTEPAPPGGPMGGAPYGGYPGGAPAPYPGAHGVPGFAPPPFNFGGRPPGPDFEISGDWEWQGWRVSGRFRYSQAIW